MNKKSGLKPLLTILGANQRVAIVRYRKYRNAYDHINSKQHRVFAMLRTKHPRIVEILIAAIIIGAVASSIVIAYNWQSIFIEFAIEISNSSKQHPFFNAELEQF